MKAWEQLKYSRVWSISSQSCTGQSVLDQCVIRLWRWEWQDVLHIYKLKKAMT